VTAGDDVVIRALATDAEAARCAHLMSTSEPWLTLGRHYDAALALLSDPARESYVALLDGEVAGFVILLMTGALVGYIQTVCVAPEHRGRGLGTRLVAFAEERIFRDSPNVFLCVSSFNPRARDLYLRLGYREVGELADLIVPGHAEILLRETLGPLQGYRPRS